MLGQIPGFGRFRAANLRPLAVILLCLSSVYILYQLRAAKRLAGVHRLNAPSQAAQDVELVFAATTRSNMGWTVAHLSKWRKNIYRVDSPTAPLRVPRNKGREAMAFLTFIIDRYNDLPEVTIFLHDQRYQWHNDNPLYDSLISIQDLQLDFVKSAGYVNLRCVWLWGCPFELEPARYMRERPNDPDHPTAVEFPNRFMELFPGEEVPELVGVPCCSQFALSRNKIRERPVDDYLRYRDWLLDTDLIDDTSGRILEYSWHMIFRKQAQYCLDPRTCYCQTYGYCNMTDEELEEQWTWRGTFLPSDWPSTYNDPRRGRPASHLPKSVYDQVAGG